MACPRRTYLALTFLTLLHRHIVVRIVSAAWSVQFSTYLLELCLSSVTARHSSVHTELSRSIPRAQLRTLYVISMFTYSLLCVSFCISFQFCVCTIRDSSMVFAVTVLVCQLITVLYLNVWQHGWDGSMRRLDCHWFQSMEGFQLNWCASVSIVHMSTTVVRCLA